MDFSPSALFAGLVFGVAGIGAFRYGRRQQRARPMLLGLALIVMPWVITGAWLQWLFGAVLVGLLFWP